MSDIKIQWHPGFVAAMDLELAENRADLVYEKEYNLNTKPLEIDLLVLLRKIRMSALPTKLDGFSEGIIYWNTSHRMTALT